MNISIINDIKRGDPVQISMFEDKEMRRIGLRYVIKTILKNDYMRKESIKIAIKNKDKEKLTELFEVSSNSFAFGNDDISWGLGVLTDRKNNVRYKIGADDMADVAIKIIKT